MSNTFDKLSVLDSFIEEVNSYLPEIEANLERLAQSSDDMDALEETYRHAHTIGGSASMMDFPGLAHVAHGMEDILGDVMDGLSILDEPTLELLRRSFGRMCRLLEGIHDGVDEDAVIAEDDADYVQYRTLLDASAQPTSATHTPVNANSQTHGVSDPLFDEESSIDLPSSSSMPSLDEVLASFRTPSVTSGENISWPEESAQPNVQPTLAQPVQSAPTSASAFHAPLEQEQDTQIETASAPASVPVSGSALDALIASTRESFPQEAPPVTPSPSSSFTAEGHEQKSASSPVQTTYENQAFQPAASNKVSKQAFPEIYAHMQEETAVLHAQASSLKDMLDQLRMAMSVIEAQRAEFKGFLDGSRDALERMEDWAGRAMGLNLRNSPDQVRRYLPLSVMWVSNKELKKVLDLLKQITSGVEMTDEQIHSVLQQLSVSIASCGKAFQQLQSQIATPAHILRQEPGWDAWEMQTSSRSQELRERVTFERRGDPAAVRAEIEVHVREELRREYDAAVREEISREEARLREQIQREYENPPLTLAARSQLEQQIRDEVRREFEAKRQAQERISTPGYPESPHEMETRLRSEIEIQVRQEFLDLITASGGNLLNPATSQTLMPPPQPAPRTSNFIEQAQQATGVVLTTPPAGTPQKVPANTAPGSSSQVVTSKPVPPVSSVPPAPVGKLVSSAPSFGGDMGEEAAEIFRLEAEEHLQTISMHVAALEKSPDNRELIQGIRRTIHTLKGAAGMMGFRAIADLSHISEDLLDSIMDGTTSVTSAVLSLILDTAETLDQLITAPSSASEDEKKVQVLRPRYTELLGAQNTRLETNEQYIDVNDIDIDDEAMMASSSIEGTASTPSSQTNAQRATRGELSVRVRLEKLDELVNLFGELLVNRSILEERIERLNRLVADVGVSSTRLRDVGQKLESRFEAATLPSGRSIQVMPGEGNRPFSITGVGNNGNSKNRTGLSHLAEFDELEFDRYTEFHQLARGLSEGISDMVTLSTEMDAVIRECQGVFGRESRLSTTFQDRLMKARLVPLSTMTPRLYRAASAVALKQHKQIDFLLEGEDTEVDRTVYEEIAGPLLHLMRNAANHAIETPEVRTQRGKPPAGQIKLSAAYEGNRVVITVRDDGTGIDPERVRKEAIARGFIGVNQAISDSDLIDLIFRPGFSTAEVLSEESGRGVGLDVVRDCVSRLRGTLEVESMPGQGTAFTMKFPTSLAIQSAMMVRVGGHIFAVPTVMVEAIGRLDSFKRATYAGRPAVLVQNELYPLSMLSQYLSLPDSLADDKSPLLFVNSGGHRVALIVDEIRNKLDVVMKNLGPHLRHVHGIAGGTVMGNGRVVLILELNELLTTRNKLIGTTMGTPPSTSVSAPKERRDSRATLAQQLVPAPVQAPRPTLVPVSSPQPVPQPPAPAATSEHGKHVLVVDDSPSVRRVVSNMLKQHGWEVQMARDGIEALDLISHETPAAVLLDIEMPRMDGYELIATVRAQEQYRTLPLVVLTSRAAAKHQQRALQLGASSYVIKPYQDEELINTLNSLVYGAAAR